MKLQLTKKTRFAFLVVFYLTHNLMMGQSHRMANQPTQTSKNLQKDSEFSQNSSAQNQSPFDAVKGKREDLKKRDLYSKHYINEDGSFTALIGAGPIHYEKNGQFHDIEHRITQSFDSNFPYANTTNLMESYFGATSHTGIKNKTAEGEVKEFLNTSMYWEVNGQAVGKINSANVPVSVQGDKAYYHNIYGNIAAEFAVLTGKRKLNYIIPNKQALGSVPAGADYLVFTEDVILPFGWTSIITDSGVMIKDAMGQEIYLYENPHSTDAESHALREENTIFETLQIGNTLTIKTKVKTEWLLSNERVFPVMVDPNITVYPNGTTQRTAQMGSSGIGEYGTIAVGYLGGYYRSYASFNTASIPDNSSIDQVVLHHNVGGGQFMSTGTDGGSRGSEIRAFLNDPGSYSTWLNRYNAVTNATNSPTIYNTVLNLGVTGWKPGVVLGTTANTHLKNGLVNDRFSIGYRPAGNYNTTSRNEYALLYGEAHDNRPYLFVTYIPPSTPPTCATLIHPANNSIGSGNQNLSLSWNEVAGATSYDLYFGTTSNPPLLASDLPLTSTLITDCLLPNTKYYWKVIPKNAYGSPTTCSTWSFTTDGKLHIYQNDWETATTGYFGTSGTSVDGWYTNNISGVNIGGYNYSNLWTVGNGTHAISGNSVGVTGVRDLGLVLPFFAYWSDLGEIHRWIYRPFDMRGLRDIEVSFKWKAGGEANQDYGSVISSINGGANWLMEEQGGLNNDGKYWNSPNTIREQTVLFPETRNNQQNFQLGFKWDDWSGNGVSGDPSFVVDDIIVKACPFEGVIDSDKVGANVFEWIPEGSTQTTLTIEGSHSCAFYQWEQSTDDGNTWVNVIGGSGGDSVSYTTPDNLTNTTLYRAKVYFGTGCPGVYQEESFKVLIEECANSTTWNGSSWSNGVPSNPNTKILFAGDYNDTCHLVGCSLEVQSGNVVIPSNSSVTIDNEIIITGGTFTLENDASLVQINPDAVNSGNITVNRNTTEMVKFDATYWSSPVAGQNLKGFSPGTLNNRFYIYNGYNAAPSGISQHFKAVFVNDVNYPMPNTIPAEWEVPASELNGNLFKMDAYTFKPGWGYSIRVPNNWPHAIGSAGAIWEKTFTGVPHNGEIKVPAFGKYTMVGNPYPSAINIEGTEGFFEENTAVETLHFWTHHFDVTNPNYNNNYITYTKIGPAGPGVHPGGENEPISNGIIAVAQGFVVENSTIEEEQSQTKWDVFFNNQMRTNEAGVFFKQENEEFEKHRYWISVSNDSEVQLGQILVGYTPEASYEVDHQIDGRRMGSAPLFSWIDENDYTVQGRPMPFEIEDIVPLGFVANLDGKYKLSLNAFDGFFRDEILRIYIRDNQTQEEHDLMSSDYWFEAVEGEYPNRFEVFYKIEEVLDNEEINLNVIQIYHEGSNIMVKSSREKILSVELWDISGRKLHQNQKVNSHLYSIPKSNFGTEVLLVTVMTEKGEITRKKIINY